MQCFQAIGPSLFLLSLAAITAPAAAEDDTQAWTSLVIQPAPGPEASWLFSFDAHARWRDDAGQLGITILRPAIGWRLNSKVDLWAGYADVDIDTGTVAIAEQRTWQQASIQWGEVLGGQVSSRTRLEQRWRDTGDDTGDRVRQLVR